MSKTTLRNVLAILLGFVCPFLIVSLILHISLSLNISGVQDLLSQNIDYSKAWIAFEEYYYFIKWYAVPSSIFISCIISSIIAYNKEYIISIISSIPFLIFIIYAGILGIHIILYIFLAIVGALIIRSLKG